MKEPVGALRQLPRGNRVNDLCSDEADEEFVIPRGDLTSEADGVLGFGPSDEVEGHVF